MDRIKKAEVSTEPKSHIAYTRVREGKVQQIPQKGAVLKKPEKERVERAEEVLGKGFERFNNLLKGYFHTQRELKEMLNLVEIHHTELERFVSEIRPLLTKFNNLEKAEEKFKTIFTAEDFQYKFNSYVRKTESYKEKAQAEHELFLKAFNMLNEIQQAEMAPVIEEFNKFVEGLKKVTAQEKFEREKVTKAILDLADYLMKGGRLKRRVIEHYYDDGLDEPKNSKEKKEIPDGPSSETGNKKEKENPIETSKEKSEKTVPETEIEAMEVENKTKPVTGKYDLSSAPFISSLKKLVNMKERGVKLLEHIANKIESSGQKPERKPKTEKDEGFGIEKEKETKKAFLDIVKAIILDGVKWIKKAEVKGYTRVRRGKMERVSPYEKRMLSAPWGGRFEPKKIEKPIELKGISREGIMIMSSEFRNKYLAEMDLWHEKYNIPKKVSISKDNIVRFSDKPVEAVKKYNEIQAKYDLPEKIHKQEKPKIDYKLKWDLIKQILRSRVVSGELKTTRDISTASEELQKLKPDELKKLAEERISEQVHKQELPEDVSEIIPYTPDLKIVNIEQLPRGVGAKYLEVIPGEKDIWVAKRWRQNPVYSKGSRLIEFKKDISPLAKKKKYSQRELEQFIGQKLSNKAASVLRDMLKLEIPKEAKIKETE